MTTHRKLLMEEMGRISVEDFKVARKTPVVVVLDNIRSLNNVGSIFRTCDALRVESLILCGITSTPPNAEIHKTALGAELSVDWKYFEHTTDAVAELRASGYTICSVEQAVESVMLQDFTVDHGARYALILGNEVKGVEQAVIDASDACIEIPQFGTKHSFNVAVTAGIVLWEVFRKYTYI